jgi:hypothetical protein
MNLDGKRKFILACFFSLASTALTWFSKLTPEGYVTMATLILAIYGAANVIDKAKGGAG